MYRLHRRDDWQARGSRAKNQSCRPRAVSTHCFLHRDALAAKYIETRLHEVMNTAMTIINLEHEPQTPGYSPHSVNKRALTTTP